MQKAEHILQAMQKLGEKRIPLTRVYRCLYSEDLFLAAYDKIARNKSALTPGTENDTVDGINLQRICDIIKQLRYERLRFRPVRRTRIPKRSGGTRPLGIPNFSEKLVQEALCMILEAYYEPRFKDSSHGFRRGRGCHTALASIKGQFVATTWFIEGDIRGCFNEIRHDRLMTIMQQRIADRQILILIERFLKAGVLDGDSHQPTEKGVPQGSVASPLFANLYLHQFDLWWWQKYGALTTREKTKRRQQGLANCRLVRFADDWILLTNGTRAQAEDLRGEARHFLWENLGLELNLAKTHVTHAKDGFDFVGFHLRWRTSSNRKPWLWVISTSDNVKRLKDKIRQMTNGQQVSDPYLKVLALNRVLRGWILYYRHANVKDIAHKLDWWVYRRFTHWLQSHHGWGVRRVLAEYEHQQHGRRKNLAVRNEHGRQVFLYRMCDLPITRYRTRNYANPYVNAERIVTQIDEAASPLRSTAWQELRRQILQRDGYACQHCNSTSGLEIHHLKARHQGGTDSPENLITLCEVCHVQLDAYRAQFAP